MSQDSQSSSGSENVPNWNQQLIGAITIESESITEKYRIQLIEENLNKGAVINAVSESDKHRNTALHIAVKKKYKVVVGFLVKNGARIDIVNRRGHTALALAEASGDADIISILKESRRSSVVDSNLDNAKIDGQTSKRRTADQNEHNSDSKKARCEPVNSGQQRHNATEEKSSSEDCDSEDESDQNTQAEASLLGGTGTYAAECGLKNSFHGVVYQLKLLMIFVLRGVRKSYDFWMATEMTAAEKFDDVVFRCIVDGKSVCRYLQAKHRLKDQSESIGVTDLLNETDDDFSLKKYFISYRKIIKHPELSQSELLDCIVCTNISLDLKNEKNTKSKVHFKITDKKPEESEIALKEVSSPDDFLDFTSVKKKSVRYKLSVHPNSELFRILKNSSDAHVLANTLAQQIFEEKAMKLRTKIFTDYHDVLATQIIDVDRGGFSEKFVNNDASLFIEAKKIREYFSVEFLRLKVKSEKKNVNTSEKAVWADIRRREKIFFKGFVNKVNRQPSRNNPGNVSRLADYEIRDDEIDEFFEKLVFAVNQPNDVELSEMIRNDIGEDSKLHSLQADLVSNSFLKEMQDWLKARGQEKGKEGVFYTSQNGKEFFDSVVDKIHTLMCSGLGSAYLEELKRYDVEFEDEIPELKAFLDGTTNKRILNLYAVEETLPTAIRVCDAIQAREKYNSEYGLIFMRLGTLLGQETKELAITTFKSPNNYNLFVIDCDNNKDLQELDKMRRQLSRIMKKEKSAGKKLIFITQKHLEKCHAVRDQVGFNNLTDITKQKLLEKRIVNFQGGAGNLISFKTVLGEQIYADIVSGLLADFGDAVDTSTLVKLIRCDPDRDKIDVGNGLVGLGEVEHFYQDRRFNPVFLKEDVLRDQTPTEMFAISGTNEEYLRTRVTNRTIQNFHDFDVKSDRLVILDNEQEKEQFRKLCEEYDKVVNIHWLRMDSQQLIWKQSWGNINVVKGYRDADGSNCANNNSNYLTENEIADDYEGRRTLLISDKAGMGKSTVLTSLAKIMRTKKRGRNSLLWVVRINLNDFTKELQKRLDNRSHGEGDDCPALIFVVDKLSNLKTDIEKKILKIMIEKHGGVAMLLDGFDEICPGYRNIVMELLQALDHCHLKKLVVSTRPYMRNDLQDKLGTFYHTMVPFSKQDRIRFLKMFWMKKLGENHVKQLTERLVKELAEQPPQQFFEQLAKKVAKQRVGRVIEQLIDRLVEQRAEESTKQPVQQPTHQFGKQSNEQSATKFGQRITEQAAKQFSAAHSAMFVNFQQSDVDLVKQCAEWSVEQLLEQFAEQLAKQAFEQPAERPATERRTQLAIQSVVQGAEQIVESFSKYVNAKTTEKLADQFPGQLSEQQAEHLDEQFAEQFTAHFVEYLAQMLTDNGRCTEQLVDQFIKQLADQPDEQIAEQFIEHRIEMYAKVVVDQVAELINDQAHVLAGNALQMHMIAEIFQSSKERKYSESERDEIGFETCEEFLDSENEKPARMPKSMNVENLYKHVVNKWFHNYFVAKLGWDLSKQNLNNILEITRNEFIKEHQDWAIQALFEVEDLGALKGSQNTEFSKRRIDPYKSGSKVRNVPVGFVVGIINGKPQFIHRSYAEYFAAHFLYENTLMNHDERNPETIKLIVKILLKPDYGVIRVFLNHLLLEHFSKYPAGQSINKPSANESLKSAFATSHDSRHQTILNIAVQQRHAGIMEYVLKQFRRGDATLVRLVWPDLYEDLSDDFSQFLVPFVAAGEGFTVGLKLLAEYDEHFADQPSTWFGKTLLHAAARYGHLETFKWLVGNRFNLDAQDEEGRTPLHEAAKSGHLNVIQWYEEIEYNLDVRDNDGVRPLYLAVIYRHVDVVDGLIRMGADPHAWFGWGSTYLHLAAMGGDFKMMQCLIDHGVDSRIECDYKGLLDARVPNKKMPNPKERSTASDVAAHCINWYLTVWFLEKSPFRDKALPREEMEHFRAAAAEFQRNNKVSAYVRNKRSGDVRNGGNDSTSNVTEELNLTTDSDRSDKIAPELGAGVGDLSTAYDLRQALRIAHKAWRTVNVVVEAIFKFFIILEHAIDEPHLQGTKRLVGQYRGVDVSAIQNEDSSTLSALMAKVYEDILGKVYDLGDGLCLEDICDVSKLHEAAVLVSQFLKKLSDEQVPNFEKDDYQMLLHWCCLRNDNLDMMELLVNRGADVNVPDKHGNTPLQLCCKDNYFTSDCQLDEEEIIEAVGNKTIMAEWLVNRGADIEACDSYGNTLLHLSCRSGNLEMVKWLVGRGANVNAINKLGQTALHVALRFHNNFDLIGYLVEFAKCDVSVVDSNEKTAQLVHTERTERYRIPHSFFHCYICVLIKQYAEAGNPSTRADVSREVGK